MRLLLLGVLMLLGCTPSPSVHSWKAWGLRLPRGRACWCVAKQKQTDWMNGPSSLPVDLDEAGLGGWSTEALRSAGYRISVIELEDTVESAPAQVPGSDPGEFLSRRPPRRGGPGGPPARRPPSLDPRPTPRQRQEMQRRTADLAALQAARELYFQRLAEARALYPNSQGYQDHHLVPVYLGGPRSGTTYRIPTAYHKLITREFRREMGLRQAATKSP